MKEKHSKSYEYWTREEFEALPNLGRFKGEPEYPPVADCFIIMPTENMHESGYRIVDIVVIKDEKPIGKFSGMTDHFYISTEDTTRHWSMDWLPVSGFMRIWASGYDLKIVSPFSTFEINAIKRL